LTNHLFVNRIVGDLSIDTGDFEYGKFVQEGGIRKVYDFGDELNGLLGEMNEVLAAQEDFPCMAAINSIYL
jgi:hypothetical protein